MGNPQSNHSSSNRSQLVSNNNNNNKPNLSSISQLPPPKIENQDCWDTYIHFLLQNESQRTVGIFDSSNFKCLAWGGVKRNIPESLLKEMVEMFKYGTPEDTWQQPWTFNNVDKEFNNQREKIDVNLPRADPADYLDKDTLLLIFSQLDSRDLGRLAICSKKWNEIASQDAFWQLEYSKKFGRRVVEGESNLKWKKLFFEKKSRRGVFKTSIRWESDTYIMVRLTDVELFAAKSSTKLAAFLTGRVLIVCKSEHINPLVEVSRLGEYLRDNRF